MTAISQPASALQQRELPPPRTRVRIQRRQPAGVRIVRFLLAVAVVGSAVWMLGFANEAEQIVFAPALTMVIIDLFLFLRLLRKEGRTPVFDLGIIFAAVMTLYTVMPLLNYAGGGMSFGELADMRLKNINIVPSKVAAIAWRYVTHFASFVLFYLLVRGGARPLTAPVRPAPRVLELCIIFSFLFCVVSEFVHGMAPAGMPHIVAQVTNVARTVGFTLAQCVALVALTRWKSRGWRFVLYGLVGFEVIKTVMDIEGRGSRGEAALLLFTVGLLYHRVVRPFTLRSALLAGSLLVTAFLTYGYLRDFDKDVRQQVYAQETALSATNEFQGLFANAYDLLQRREARTLTVPWQIYYSELYMVIPQQFLPFAKISPADWYTNEVLGRDSRYFGAMYGVIAQSILGLDWIELFLRGMLLGLIFGGIHRWYSRRPHSFRATFAYAFFCTWAYYSMRLTTLAFVHMTIYFLLPALIGPWVLTFLFTRVRRGARALVPARRARA